MNWLREQTLQNPGKLFILEGAYAYSYMDVAEMVQAYLQAFLREGIQPHNRILIYLPGSIEMVEIILACFEIGAIATPISQKLTNKEYEHFVATLQPRLIITNWDEKKSFRSGSFPFTNIEELLSSSSGCSMLKNEYEKNSDDVCAIVLTSGTSGSPKPVQLTYGNFETSCKNWNGFLNFEDTDQFLCCLPLHHIGGLPVIIRALIYSFSVHLVQTFEAQTMHNVISKHPVTIISLVPTMLKRILEIDGGLESLKTLRHMLLGGGPAPGYLLDQCIREKLPIIKVYGMSETCSGTFGLNLLKEPQYKLYAGRPFPGAKVWIETDAEVVIR